MKYLSLRWKISFIMLLTNILISVFLIVFLRYQVYNNLGKELISKGRIIGSDLALFAAEQIVEEDKVGLRQLISNSVNYESVEYVLIQKSDSTILVDTYNGNVPQALLDQPVSSFEHQGDAMVKMVNQDNMDVYDIWVPVEEGYLGYIRVGIRQDYVRERVLSTATKVIGIITLAVLLMWGLIVYIVTNKIINPMLYLKQKADEISQGKLDEKIVIHTHDEIEQLGDALERLRESVKIALERLKKQRTMRM